MTTEEAVESKNLESLDFHTYWWTGTAFGYYWTYYLLRMATLTYHLLPPLQLAIAAPSFQLGGHTYLQTLRTHSSFPQTWP